MERAVLPNFRGDLGLWTIQDPSRWEVPVVAVATEGLVDITSSGGSFAEPCPAQDGEAPRHDSCCPWTPRCSSRGLRYSWGRVLEGERGLEVPPWGLKAEQEIQFALYGEP